jgi:hypothetical protein
MKTNRASPLETPGPSTHQPSLDSDPSLYVLDHGAPLPALIKNFCLLVYVTDGDLQAQQRYAAIMEEWFEDVANSPTATKGGSKTHPSEISLFSREGAMKGYGK